MNTNDADIGHRLASLRDRMGMSQKTVADRMRVKGHKWSQATVWSVERGDRPLRLSEAYDLTAVLAFPLGYLVGAEPAADVTKGLTVAIDTLTAYRQTFLNSAPTAIDIGIVKSVGESRVEADVSGVTYNLVYPDDYRPEVGDRVYFEWNSGIIAHKVEDDDY